MTKPDTNGIHFGPYWFTPGLAPINIATALYAAFSTLGVITFMSFIQPYLLTEVLQIPESEQGSLSGRLGVYQEVIVILLTGFVGATADRRGIRIVYAVGFLTMGIGYLIYPLADAVWQLYLFRTFFAIGAAIIPVMLSTCVVEYIQDVSRGKWVGTSSIFNGLGVMFMSLVLAKTPQFYFDMGSDPISAGRFAFWTAMSLCFISAAIVYFGLKNISGTKVDHSHENILKSVKEGILEARNNSKIALAFGAAFIGRGDLVVVGTFFSLWIKQVGLERGMTSAEGLAYAGFLFGAVIQLSALCWAFFMGMIADRVNRVLALCIGLTIAAIGYGGMGQVADPFDLKQIIPWCIILGMGETSVIVAGGALLGQEMPLGRRSAVVGAFTLAGGIGIMVANFAGGEVFDAIAKTAPFTMMAIVNIIVMLIAFAMWYFDPKRSFKPGKATEEAAATSDS